MMRTEHIEPFLSKDATMVTAALYAPANAVAVQQDPKIVQPEQQKAMRHFNANVALQHKLIGEMIPHVSQAVRLMTADWPNKAIAKNLSGVEVSQQTYDVINRFGGLLPPPETQYGCIFFTFSLREGEKRVQKLGQRTIVTSSLFIENVELTKVLEGV
jgi:hypothetical protein